MLCVCVYVCLCVCVKTVCTQSHPYLSFHDFPSDDQLRASWVTAIRREEGATFKILRGSTYVCSLHFNNDDIYCTPKGFRRIKRGAVPSKIFTKETETQYRLLPPYYNNTRGQGRIIRCYTQVTLKKTHLYHLSLYFQN
uniref:THAP domain-containing protein 1 n=1 Tax=Seriola lalandi dorsalis TaxID=1841481 RepID=A0A3B4XEZ3_SERLL